MKKIGLTGNIASGKTTIENILKDHGCKVLDADDICHDAMEHNLEIIEKIKNAFKNLDILDENDNISRRKLGKIVFSSENHKKTLENILHPHVIKEIEGFFNKNKNDKIVIASVPLLFEIGIEEMFDVIIFVSAQNDIRLKRLMKRNNLSEDEAMARIFAQDTEDDKIKKSDFVIYNNGDTDELYNSTISVMEKLKLL